jgi:hypothetical protein
MRALVALMVMVPMAVGCHRATTETKVFLSDSGAEVDAPFGAIPVEAPLNMGVEKTMTLVSQSSSQWSALTVATSCGCASALLSDTTLQPGGSITLRLSFDPESVVMHRRVRAVIRHQDAPEEPFVIQANYSNTEALEGWRIVPTPREVSIDDSWSVGYVGQWTIALEMGKEVDPDTLSVSASSPCIRCVLTEGASPSTASLEVEIENPPIGKIDEKVQVRVSRNGDVYYAKIPVVGEFLPPFYCDPATVTVARDQTTGRAAARINVTRRQASIDFPQITASGSWELRDVKKTGDNQWEVCVVSGEDEPNSVGYGVLRLSGDWNGADIVVPLTAVSAE